MNGLVNNIWFFGASNTTYWDTTHQWTKDYIKFCGYTPKHFTEILSGKLNLNLINKGIGATDNYTIFETILSNIDNIKEGDKIVVDWVSILRFRVVANDKFKTIISTDGLDEIAFLSKNTMNEILINRDSILYVNEVIHWSNVLKKIFKNNIIFWSIFKEFKNNSDIIYMNSGVSKFSIINETNGCIKDLHLGEAGHIELSNHLYSKFSNKII
jgi:hypothetical protein